MLALGDKLNLMRIKVASTSGNVIEHAGPTDIGANPFPSE